MASITKAAYCLTTKQLSSILPNNCKPIEVDNVLISTAIITKIFYPDSVTDDFDPQTQSSTEIRTRIRKLLHTSQVDVIDANDIEFYRERRKIVIDANYEVRFPLFWIVDGVMNFEDLIFKVDGN